MSVSVATSETSFVHAISAAGVMYTLTRNCSLGDLDNCGCDGSRNGQIGNTHNTERVDLKVIILLHPAMCAHTCFCLSPVHRGAWVVVGRLQ